MEHGHSHLRSNPHNVLGHTIDLLNPSSNQVMLAPGYPTSFNVSQFSSHHDNCTSHMDLCNHHYHHHHHQQQQQQQQPHASNHDLDSVGWSIFENSYMNSSSFSNYYSTPVTGSDQMPSSSMRGVYRNHHYTGNAIGSCKDKNAGQVPTDRINDVPNSGSSSVSFTLHSGIQNWVEPCEVGFNMMGATNVDAPECRGGFLPFMEGPQPDIIRLQMESPFWFHQNHNLLLPGNYCSPIFQPGLTWVEQHRSNAGMCSMWNNPTIPYFEGSFGFGNMGGLHGSAFGRTAFAFPSPSHSQHHLQPVQGMHVPNYSHHPRIPALSHGLSVNNLLHHGTINTARERMASVTRVPRPFPSTSDEWSYRPSRRMPQAATDLSGDQMRILSAQDNAVLEFPVFHGADNFFDRHREMRLDIDNMSYEELLALEEQIGDVKTGLPEEVILKNLKMRTFATPALLLNSSSGTDPEIGSCIICQVEYAENERMGTLCCGHEYHADCIKQWLLVKNICPICKTSALDTDER